MPFKRFKNEKEKKRARQAFIRQETVRPQDTMDDMDAIHNTPIYHLVPEVECIEYQTPYATVVDMKDVSLHTEKDLFMAATPNGMWCKTNSMDHVRDLIRMVQCGNGNMKLCIRVDRCDEAKLNELRNSGRVVKRTLN